MTPEQLKEILAKRTRGDWVITSEDKESVNLTGIDAPDQVLVGDYMWHVDAQAIVAAMNLIDEALAVVEAGNVLSNEIEQEPWEYSDRWAKDVHKAWLKYIKIRAAFDKKRESL